MKKAFTLLELLLVVVIVWVLMWAMQNMFSYENVNKLKFDTCYLKTHWLLSSFKQEALLQKSVRTWWNLVWSDKYIVLFDSKNQKIEFVYSWAWVKKTINYSWSWSDTENDCYNTTYNTRIWNSNLKAVFQAWFQTSNTTDNSSAMQIFSWDNFDTRIQNSWTWEIFFYYCKGKWVSAKCSQLYKIIIEPKVQLFKSFSCKSLNSDWRCKEWNK